MLAISEKFRRSLVILSSCLFFSLSACRDYRDQVIVNPPAGNGNESGNGNDNQSGGSAEERRFTCLSANQEPLVFGLSSDLTTLTVNPDSDNESREYLRVPEEQGASSPMIEYRRLSIPENPDRVEVSRDLVEGESTGELISDDVRYLCSESVG